MALRDISSEVGKGAVGNALGNSLTDVPYFGSLLGLICAVVPVLLLFKLLFKLFFKKNVLEQSELKGLCERVKKKRGDPKENGKGRFDQELLLEARHLLKNRLNRWLNSQLCELLKKGDSLDALLEALPKVWFVFGASDFWRVWDAWCRASNDMSRPRVGINAPAEDFESGYDEKSRKVLVQKIVKHFSDWRESSRPNDNNLYIKWIGANDIALVSATLDGFAGEFAGRIHVLLPCCTVTDANSKKLEERFPANGDNRVTVEVSDGGHDGGYDIVISTHFWQHHSEYVVVNSKLELNRNGLFVLLAAIARDSEKDEYVCEGWTPMRAEVRPKGWDNQDDNNPSYSVEFRPMGANSQRSKICYYWSKTFKWHEPVLSWGFPKSVAVEPDVVSNNQKLSDWIKKYFQWGSGTDAATYWRKSVVGVVEQPPVEVTGVQICARAQAKSDDQAVTATDSITEYLRMELKYSVKGDDKPRKLPIIGCIGYEKNEWRSEQIGDKVPITFHPAHEVKLNAKDKLLEQVLADIGQDCAIVERYRSYIPDLDSPCVDSAGGRVWRIHTRIHEADLNDLLIFESNESKNGQSSRHVFYSYLPKRRYLTKAGYDQGLAMLDKYKDWTEKLRKEKGNIHGDSLLRFDSVTWLWSYQRLLNFCKTGGLQINAPDHDLYFHKVYCELSDKDADNKVLMEDNKGLMEMQSERDSLCNKQCCVAKDEAFNKLPVNDRIRLLARLNVHDVLLFAQKKA